MAERFFVLATLGYFDGGPFYRVLANATARKYAQFGYRVSRDVDAVWTHSRLSNVTSAVVPPGNVRGTVAFGTDFVDNTGTDPNCRAPKCSQGFSVELFINLDDNPNLDPVDFSPFGYIAESEMASVVDRLYSGYGECADLCPREPPTERAKDDREWCYWDNRRHAWAGVNMTTMLTPYHGRRYLEEWYPLMDAVTTARIVTTARRTQFEQ